MFAALSVAMLACKSSGPNFKTYAYSPAAPKSEHYKVFIDGAECYAYPAPGGDIANFDLWGEVEVEIRSAREVKSAVVRPLSARISPRVEGSTVKFKMSKPAFLCVEINGDLERPLFVFANPREESAPKKSDKNVMFFEAGKIYDIGQQTRVPSETTVYVEGGAIVYGTFLVGDNFKALPSKNVSFLGRGIISGEKIPWASSRSGKCSNLIQINTVDNLKIQGITAVQSPNWTIPIFASRNIHIDGIKTVGKVDWDDGIDIVSCSDVLIENSFIYNKDDCIAIKAAVDYSVKYFDHTKPNSTENVVIRDCVLWNGVFGNCLEIGFETRGDCIRNIVYKNLDIIHVQDNPWNVKKALADKNYLTGEMVFTIHNGDRAHISDVLYEDIRVEDTGLGLIDFRIMVSRYSKDKVRGKISNVAFRNITVTSPYKIPYSRIRGFDEKSNISGISFQNFVVNGVRVDSLERLNLVDRGFVENITFKE